MKLLIYFLFPKLMPKKYINDAGIIYTYDPDDDVFVGSNNVQLGMKYIVKNYKPYKK